MRRKSRGRRLLAVLLVILGSGLGFYLSRAYWLAFPATILIRDDHPAQGADGIIILGGGMALRLPKAVEIFRAGGASRIIFCRIEDNFLPALGININESEVMDRRITEEFGVPRSAVDFVREGAVTSTQEEAQTLLAHIRRTYPGAQRFIIVTTWSHTSRAGWIFERLAGTKGPRFEIVPAMGKDFTPAAWWQKEDPFLQVFNEYLKWIFYRIHY